MEDPASTPPSSGLCRRASSAWQGRPLPPAWRAASLSLRVSPPPRQMAVGRKLDALLGIRAWRCGEEGRRVAAGSRVFPARAGHVLTYRQRKELAASKVLFTAGLGLLRN
jgi:hypothetical protein